MIYLLYAAVFFCVVIFNTTLVVQLPFFYGFYDLLLLLVIYLGFYRSVRESLPFVIAFGIVMDGISGGTFGLYLTSYFWLYVFVLWLTRYIRVNNTMILPGVVACGVIIQNAIFLGSMAMLDPNMDGKLDAAEVEGFIRQFFKTMNDNLQFWSLFLGVVLQPGVKAYLDDQPFGNIMDHFAPKLLDYFDDMGYDDPELEMLTISAMIEGYGSLLLFVEAGSSFPEETLRKYEDRMVEMFTRKKNKK